MLTTPRVGGTWIHLKRPSKDSNKANFGEEISEDRSLQVAPKYRTNKTRS